MGILEDKILALSDKTIEKQDRLSGYSDTKQQNQQTNLTQNNLNVWTPTMLESMTDADSPQFIGTTGGLGGVDKLTGKRYDLTGKETEDRIEGFDAYEVPHPGDNYKNTESGKKKFDMQRARLASELGLNPNEVTDDMIYQKGTEQKLMALYNMIPGEKAEWTPGPLDFINENTPLELGSKEYPLNIEVERLNTGKFGHFGRPLTDVRNKDTKEGIGESIGYEKPKFEQVAAKDALENISSKYGTTDGKNIQMPGEDTITDALQYAGGSFAANVGDAVVDAAGRIALELTKGIKDMPEKEAVKYMKEDMPNSKAWFDENMDFKLLDKYKEKETYGYKGEATEKAMNRLGEAYDSGDAVDMASSVIEGVYNAGLPFLAESAAYIAASMSKKGYIAVASIFQNDILEERAKVVGGVENISNAERMAIMPLALGAAVVEKVADKVIFTKPQFINNLISGALKSENKEATETVLKTIAKKTGEAIGKGVAIGGTTEAIQTGIEEFGALYGTDEQEKLLEDETFRKMFQAYGAGVAGDVTGAAAIEILPKAVFESSKSIGEKFGGLKDSAVNKAKEIKNKTSDIVMDNPNEIVAKEDAEAAKVNVANYNTKMDNITARITAGDITDSEVDSMLDDIKEASLYASKSKNIDEETQDIIYGKVLANNRALTALMASRRDDVLKNGNTSRMQSLASDPQNKEKFKRMLDITDEEGNAVGEIDFNDELIVKNYMKAGKDAGLDEETLQDIKDEYVAVSEIRKSINDVSKEVSTGARGYLTYRQNVEDAINEENLEKIDENLSKMDKFVESQQNKLSALDKAIAKVEAEVRKNIKLNGGKVKGNIKGINADSEKFTYPSGKTFEINYRNVYENLGKDVKTGGIYGIRSAVAKEAGAMAKAAELTAKEVSQKIEGFKRSSESSSTKINERKNLLNEINKASVAIKKVLPSYTGKTINDNELKGLPEEIKTLIKQDKKNRITLASLDKKDDIDIDNTVKKPEDKKPPVDKKPPEDITYKAPVDKSLEDITYKDEKITYSDEEIKSDENIGDSNISDIDFDMLPKEKPKDINKAPAEKEPITYKEPADNGEITYADIDYGDTDISGAINYKDTMNDIKEFNDNFEITYSDFDIDSNTGALESKKIEKSEAIKAIESKIEELKYKIKYDYAVQKGAYAYLNSDEARKKYSGSQLKDKFTQFERLATSNKVNRDKIREEIKLLQDKLTGTDYIKDIIDNTSSNMNAVSVDGGAYQRVRVSEIVQPSKVGKNRLSGMPISEITNNKEILKYKDDAVDIFKKMLSDPNDDIANRKFKAKDSLFRGLLFRLTDNGVAEINENVAVALALAGDEYYAFMSSKLAYNDKDAIAAMLGKQPHEVSPDIQKAFAHEGLFKKLIADNLGKAAFSNLSLAPASKIVGKNADGSEKVVYEGVDSELYAKMLSDAGQMVLLYMQAKEYIEPLNKSTIPIDTYTKALGIDNRKKDKYGNFIEDENSKTQEEIDAEAAKEFNDLTTDKDSKSKRIPMVQLKKPAIGKKYSVKEKTDMSVLKAEVLAKVDMVQSILALEKNSKGPMFTKPKTLEDKNNKVKNSKVNKAANESFKVLNKIRQEAYEVNSEAVDLMLEKRDRSQTLSIMGFKTEDDLEKMAFDDRESAEARNREIEESYDNLISLHDKVAGKDATEANEMYFEYFFGKNGRFYMDSVTVNPQTDKLHRFLVTLKAHRQIMDFNSPDAEKNKQQEYFKTAIAQAFGFGIDKKTPQEIYDFADAVLEQSEETLTGALTDKKHKAEIKKDGKKYEVEIEHLGHFFQGLNAVRAYKKAGNGERPFEVSLSVEFDAITSGFILKLLQLPIMSFEKMKLWLSKGGVFLYDGKLTKKQIAKMSKEDKQKYASDIKDYENYMAITNSGQEISEGRLIDSYRTLAQGMDVTGFEVEVENEERWKALQEVLPKIKDQKEVEVAEAPDSSTKEDEDGEDRLKTEIIDIVTSEGRSLFKDPFMTFGYAAAIKSIKRHLGYKMISGLPKMMLDDSSPEAVKKANKFINSIHGKELEEKEIKAFKETLKNTAFEDIQINNYVTVKDKTGKEMKVKSGKVAIAGKLREIVEMTYGSNVEQILTAEFGELIEANNRINNSFKIMFQAWKVAYDARVEKVSGGKGLTADQENKILDELKVLFPMIKAPLAGENYMEDGETVAIFSTGLTNAKSGYGPTQTHVNPDKFGGQKTLTVQSMIREFQAAISAGAVVPIHYIDGSAMTKSLEEGGVLGVHDAKLTGINNAQDEIIKYNKDVYEISKDYSLAKEILKSLERVRDNAKKLGVDLDKLEGLRSGKNKPVKRFDSILDEMRELNEVAESGRKLVYGSNAKIGHMAGLDGSMYEIKGGKVVEPEDRTKLTIKAPDKKESVKKETKPVEIVSETSMLNGLKNGKIQFKNPASKNSPYQKEIKTYEEFKQLASEYADMTKSKNIDAKESKYIDGLFEMFGKNGIKFNPITIVFKQDKEVDGYGMHSAYTSGKKLLTFPSTKDFGIENTQRVMLHEYAHAITVYAMKQNKALDKKANELRNYVYKNSTVEQRKQYGLSDKKGEAYEFVAEAISNPSFQEFLSGFESVSSNKSLFEDVKNLFKAILRFVDQDDGSKSALTDALEIVLELNGYVAKENAVNDTKVNSVQQVLEQYKKDENIEKENAKLLEYIQDNVKFEMNYSKQLAYDFFTGEGIAGNYDWKDNVVTIADFDGLRNDKEMMKMLSIEQVNQDTGALDIKAASTQINMIIDEVNKRNIDFTTKLHESVHAAVYNYMRSEKGKTYSEEMTRLYEVVKQAAEANPEMFTTNKSYWAKDVDEFLAEALSKPELIKDLMKIDVEGNLITGAEKSMFEKIIDMVVEALGLSTKEDKLNMHKYLLDSFKTAVEANKDGKEYISNKAPDKEVELNKKIYKTINEEDIMQAKDIMLKNKEECR